MMWDLDVTAATLLLKEFRDPNKLTSDHLSSECGQLSYDHTTAEHHEAMLGKEATNDNAESPFAILTMQMEIFNTIGINNASALALAWHNNDFYRRMVSLDKREKNISPLEEDGTFINFAHHMAQSLLQTAVDLSANVQIMEQKAKQKQVEKKRKKVEALLNLRLSGATKTYVDQLFYREMYDSRRCWQTEEVVDLGEDVFVHF